MNKSKSYIGIDYFRLISAFLVIAIHMSPLSSYSETGNFILNDIIARVAVPFFLMTSGFFLISGCICNADKLKDFIKKTAFIYGIAIVVYIPLNIYNGYFTMDDLLPNIIKDIFFRGTFYHLWYLPASIIGAVVSWLLIKKAGFKKAFIITTALYIIAVLGDTYYELTKNIALLKNLYYYIFEIFIYTRNGIFFAPVFFVLGGMIAEQPTRISLKSSRMGLGISFLLMFGEGILLYKLGLQGYNSMNFLLLPCMYFLFYTLTFYRGRRISSLLRRSILAIYIVHPMVITVIGIFADNFDIQVLFIENSLMYYLMVSIISTVLAVGSILLFSKLGKRQLLILHRKTEYSKK